MKERLLPQHMLPIMYSCSLTVEGRMVQWRHVTGKPIKVRTVLASVVLVYECILLLQIRLPEK